MVERPVVELLREALAEARKKDTTVELELGKLERACEKALSRTETELEQASKQAKAKREDVLVFERLLDFLEAAERLSALNNDVSRTELVQARTGLQQALRASDLLARVAASAGDVAEAEAKERTAAVSPRLDYWFSQVSMHDRLTGARVRVELTKPGGRLRNSYRLRAVERDGGWEAAPGPMLSGGYQTALAVAALCALADVGVAGHGLDLLVLDEPTQNLDPELTVRLGKALVESAPAERTIVTTADGPFAQAIERAAGAAGARIVRLAPWTQARGTQVS